MEITTKKLKLSQIKPNPDNPRKIGKVEMERLVKSLQDFPEMLELREIIVDENNIILGGNMRYRALKQIGEKECVAKIVTGLTVDQKREFIIKDNSNFGSYDMDALANLWSDLPLVEWGVDLPEDWGAPPNFEPGTEEDQGRLDEKKPITCRCMSQRPELKVTLHDEAEICCDTLALEVNAPPNGPRRSMGE